MRTLWISVCVTLIIAFVEAQRNINLSKPVVSLEKRPRVPTWRRAPEERKKLSIFPKNNKKFVVTERTTLKNEATTPATATKRPLMRKLFVQDKNGKNTFSFPPRKALMEPKRFNVPIVATPKLDNTRNFKTKVNEPTAEESTIKTVVTSVRTESSVNTFKLNRGNLIQVLDNINKATGGTPAKTNEKPNKFLNKQETKAVFNNDALKVNSPAKIVEDSVTEEIVTEESATEEIVTEESVTEESVTKKSANNRNQNIKAEKIEEHVKKVTENILLGKQEDKPIENNASSHAKMHDEGSDEYEYEEIYYDNSEANVTTTDINEQVSESTEKVFLSKQINNVIQNNDMLKVNLSDNVSNDYAVEKNNQLFATPAQIINNEEYESTTHVFTKASISFSKPLQGRSLDSNDIELNDQSDHLFLDLSNKHRSEKTGDFSKLDHLEKLMKAIAKNTWSDSDQKPTLRSNDVKNFATLKKDFNENSEKNQPQEFVETSSNYYEVKPAIDEDESKISTGNNIDAAVTEIIEKKGAGSTETSTTYTNTEMNKNGINVDIINNFDDLVEVITSNFTSTDVEAFTESSSLLKLDLNIIEEYTNKSDIILSGFDETTTESDAYDSLTESPIEITFDNLKRPSEEEISNKPSNVKHVIIDEPINDVVAEFPKKYEDGKNNTFIEIDNSNKEQNNKDENSVIIDYLHDLAASINDKSTDGDNTEVTDDKKQFVNLDMTIVEEYSDKPDINTSEAEGSIQESYLNDNNISLTESPIEIIFDSQEALVTEKLHFESTFNKNVNETDEVIFTADDTVIDDSLNGEDGNTNIIGVIENLSNEQNVNENVAVKNSLPNLNKVVNDNSNIHDKSKVAIDGGQAINEHENIVDEDTVKPDTVTVVVEGTFGTHEAYIEGGHVLDAAIEMLLNDPLSEDETITNNTNDSVTYGEVDTDGKEHLNHHISIAEDDSNKRDLITVVIHGNLDTRKAYYEHVTDAPVTIVFNESESSNFKESERIQFNLTEDVISKEETPVTEVSQKVEDIIETLAVEQSAENNTNSPGFVDIINNESIVGDKNEMTSGLQLVNLHINIAEENSDKPKTITIVFDGTTQKTYLNGEHIDNDPIGILFDNLEPLGPNKLLPSGSLNQEVTESVTEKSTSSDDVIINEATTDKATDEDISDEWLVMNSSPSVEINSNEPIILKPNNLIGEDLLNESNGAGEDISSESIVDNFIITSVGISKESSIIGSSSILTNEIISKENKAEADQSKELIDEVLNESQSLNNSFSGIVTNEEMSYEKNAANLADEISEDLHVLNETSSRVVTNEEISDENNSDKSENMTGEILNKPYIVNDSFNNAVTNANISDEKMADKSENLTDEISNEYIILNESSSGFITNEELSDETTADKSENMSKEILNESHIANDSFSTAVTNVDISDEKMADKSENLTDEISNEYIVVNESSSGFITNEELSDEKNADKSENMSKEILNESHIANDSFSTVVTNVDISDEKMADKSENFTDEISNEYIVVNESSSGFITNEELSDETTADKSENMSREIVNESHIANDSFSTVVTNVDISDEKMADKSENLTDEISNEYIVVNESSSGFITNEELSDETTADKSENMSNEIVNESHIANDSFNSVVTNADISDEKMADKSENLTDEISNEYIIVNESSSDFITNEEVSDEKMADKSENMTDEISNESYLENDSSRSLTTNEEESDEMIDDKSDNLTVEIPIKSPVTVTETSSTNLSGEEIFDEITDQPNDETSEDTGPAIDIRHPSTELASHEILINRRKRSNNIIEEENLATTLSGFKYTGQHETRLGHNLSFKNINA